MQERLGHNQFQRPLHLESREAPGEVAGDIYALLDSAFEAAGTALSIPDDWCDILILHANTKTCRVASGSPGTVLSLWIGTKHDQPLAEAFRVNFAYHVRARSANYLRVALSAGAGPMSTRDYRIVLEAVPLENGRTFIHLAYSYGYGVFGRLAMQTYLATAGRSKVGFTIVGAQPDGRLRHIGGLRGVVERNTMRYYLAIEAFLGASAAPMRRIKCWKFSPPAIRNGGSSTGARWIAYLASTAALSVTCGWIGSTLCLTSAAFAFCCRRMRSKVLPISVSHAAL